MHNTASVLENYTHKLLWDFEIQIDQLISVRRPGLIIINQNMKRICKIVDFAVPADHRIKLKDCEKRISTSTFLRNRKKYGTCIPFEIGAFSSVTKRLLKGLEDLEAGRQVKTIQTIALLGMARILRRVLETCGDLLSPNL